jgi:hypothetical protein
MIDTIKFRLQDYSIAKDTRLTLQPSPREISTDKELSSHILYSDKQHTIQGQKAYLNTPLYKADLQQGKNGSPALYVQTSIAKVLNGTNYSPTALNELKTAFSKIEKDLKGLGIRTNIDESFLSRLDVFKNVLISEGFMSYSPVFQQLRMNYANQRDYGSSFLFYNNNVELSIYDKVTEMLNRKEDVSGIPKTARTELRLKVARKIKNSLEMQTVSDLIRDAEYLPEFYNQYLAKNIYKYRTFSDVPYSLSNDYLQNVAIASMRNGNLSFSKFKDLLSVTQIIQNEPQILDLIKQHSANRMNVTRAKQTIDRLKTVYWQITQTNVNRTLSDLYAELREKTLAS